MAHIEDLHRLIAETIYTSNPFEKEELPPYGPDKNGVLRGKPLIAHIQARSVLEALGLLDGVVDAVTYRQYGVKNPERFEDDYVPNDIYDTRKSVLADAESFPGAFAVERRAVRIEGPWHAIEKE